MKTTLAQALKTANAKKHRLAMGNARQAESKGRSRLAEALSEMRIPLRSAVREARRLFRQEVCPLKFRRWVCLAWDGETDSAISFDYMDYKVNISLSYRIDVFGMSLHGHFRPHSEADCEAEAWRAWGIVHAMLCANISKLPEDESAAIRALQKVLPVVPS